MLRLAESPAVSIGVVDGDERYQLVLVAAAWKQQGGRIVVLDTGRDALLFFDSTGVFLAQAGGRGQGPGEMQRAGGGWPYRGDSIATYDLMMRRVTIYDRDGTYARSFTNPVIYRPKPGHSPSQSCCTVRAVFADGSFVGHPPDDIPTAAGADRYSTFAPWWISPDGSEAHPIATFESRLFRYHPSSRSGVQGYATSYYFRYVTVDNRLIGGNGYGSGLHSVEFTIDDNKGTVSTVMDTVQLPRSGQPFSPELQAAYTQALREDYDPNRYEGTLESYMDPPLPDTAPAFVNIASSVDGNVWLERWTPERSRSGAQRVYDVITVSGDHVKTVSLSPGSRLLWADGRQVLLLERDDLDVQYVRLYDLIEGAIAP
jgi:hypothetical protein